MAHYTVEQAASLVEGSDISDRSDSELEEDPAFPLPRVESDDDYADSTPHLSSPPSQGRGL